MEQQYEFLKVLHYCNIGRITLADVIEKYPLLCKVLKGHGGIGRGNGNGDDVKFREYDSKAKRTRLIQDLQDDDGTPSYRLVSAKYPKYSRNHRSQVLNDEWVCVPFAAAAKEKENSFTEPRILSPNEEAMNQYEDHRYEIDMTLSYFGSALKNVEKLLNGIHRKEISLENCFKVEDHLSVLNLRCIEQMYEGRIMVLEILQEDPMIALPTIYNRLNEKVDELEQTFKIATSFGL